MAERQAICICGEKRASSDRERLAFFEDRGPGSAFSRDTCRICRCKPVAHLPSVRPTRTGFPSVIGVPHAFEPLTEGIEFDSFYCGCRGWD